MSVYDADFLVRSNSKLTNIGKIKCPKNYFEHVINPHDFNLYHYYSLSFLSPSSSLPSSQFIPFIIMVIALLHCCTHEMTFVSFLGILFELSVSFVRTVSCRTLS